MTLSVGDIQRFCYKVAVINKTDTNIVNLTCVDFEAADNALKGARGGVFMSDDAEIYACNTCMAGLFLPVCRLFVGYSICSVGLIRGRFFHRVGIEKRTQRR